MKIACNYPKMISAFVYVLYMVDCELHIEALGLQFSLDLSWVRVFIYHALIDVHRTGFESIDCYK